MTKLVKVTVSGSFRDGNNNIVDFDNMTGVVPSTDEERIAMHVQSRYVPIWISKNKDIKQRPKNIRQVFIDNISEEYDGELSCVGKNIKELSYEELQDLATLKDLRGIPLYRNGSLRDNRVKAIEEYSKHILKNEIAKDTKFDLLPDITVEDGSKYYEQKKVSNDVSIALEARQSGLDAEIPKGEKHISFAELKQLADEMGITYHPNIGYDKLKTKVFGEE